ncbi:hypothetical protein TIFTF001_034551 [Ficus carica]|uniref:Disease resistance R13L4/SHOC-2-like LRR domain-containing protein n=1 Tax=Ficus carica TaxID=3494 RepID=A0AA88E031_FICCA|nr:hypothetical protein TIFTF001_034530 [Ficus carica]GMN65477.1 hypothetical protein TIFTF001_034551 [Ficus carica]
MPIAMMSRSAPRIVVFIVLLIYLTGTWGSNPGVGEPKVKCREAERQGLLKIKEDDYEDDEYGLLSSWGNEEEKETAVNGLEFGATTNPYLRYLDLSGINFYEQYSIPSFIGKLSKLRYLNLSYTSLNGEIPSQLGNLSSLQFLDLSGYSELYIRNPEWVSHLSSLRVLDLSSNNMSLAHDWVQVVNNLPSLIDLKLRDCNLPDIVHSHLSLVNASKFLAVLDLSENNFSSNSLFQWLFNYSRSLVHLELTGCLYNTSIPQAFGNMASLKFLVLIRNFLKGSIPNSFGNMTSLTYLDLVACELVGPIPQSFGNMIALTFLDLGFNHLEGSIPESFGNLIALTYLDLGFNQLEGSIPRGFGNMASLEYLDLKHNMLEGEIPKSIWKLCALQQFYAYNNSLSGQLRFAESSSICSHFPLEFLNLEYNRNVGSLPDFTLGTILDKQRSKEDSSYLYEIDLSSNQLEGSMPLFLLKVEFLNLFKNKFSDLNLL